MPWSPSSLVAQGDRIKRFPPAAQPGGIRGALTTTEASKARTSYPLNFSLQKFAVELSTIQTTGGLADKAIAQIVLNKVLQYQQ